MTKTSLSLLFLCCVATIHSAFGQAGGSSSLANEIASRHVVVSRALIFWEKFVPSWVVICPHCRREFPHTEINQAALEEASRDPYRVLPRPSAGKRTCPHCKRESAFLPNDLRFRG
jgi:hypothetical protein